MSYKRQKVVPEDPHEFTKLLLDYYKHLSTLSGAGIVVMLTVFREDVLERFLVFYTVASFAIAILVCLSGYILTLVLFDYPLTLQENGQVPIPLSALVAAYLFGQAIVSLLTSIALSVAWFATLAVFIICGVVLMLWVLRSNLTVPWRELRQQGTKEQRGRDH